MSGQVSEYGMTLVYTEAGKPQATFTLVCEEAARDGGTFKTFLPVVMVGAQAEAMADTLEAGEMVVLKGKLSYQRGKGKDSGKLAVTCFAVERLSQPTEAWS